MANILYDHMSLDRIYTNSGIMNNNHDGHTILIQDSSIDGTVNRTMSNDGFRGEFANDIVLPYTNLKNVVTFRSTAPASYFPPEYCNIAASFTINGLPSYSTTVAMVRLYDSSTAHGIGATLKVVLAGTNATLSFETCYCHSTSNNTNEFFDLPSTTSNAVIQCSIGVGKERNTNLLFTWIKIKYDGQTIYKFSINPNPLDLPNELIVSYNSSVSATLHRVYYSPVGIFVDEDQSRSVVFADGDIIDGEGILHIPKKELYPFVGSLQPYYTLNNTGYVGVPITVYRNDESNLPIVPDLAIHRNALISYTYFYHNPEEIYFDVSDDCDLLPIVNTNGGAANDFSNTILIKKTGKLKENNASSYYEGLEVTLNQGSYSWDFDRPMPWSKIYNTSESSTALSPENMRSFMTVKFLEVPEQNVMFAYRFGISNTASTPLNYSTYHMEIDKYTHNSTRWLHNTTTILPSVSYPTESSYSKFDKYIPFKMVHVNKKIRIDHNGNIIYSEVLLLFYFKNASADRILTRIPFMISYDNGENWYGDLDHGPLYIDFTVGKNLRIETDPSYKNWYLLDFDVDYANNKLVFATTYYKSITPNTRYTRMLSLTSYTSEQRDILMFNVDIDVLFPEFDRKINNISATTYSRIRPMEDFFPLYDTTKVNISYAGLTVTADKERGTFWIGITELYRNCGFVYVSSGTSGFSPVISPSVTKRALMLQSLGGETNDGSWGDYVLDDPSVGGGVGKIDIAITRDGFAHLAIEAIQYRGVVIMRLSPKFQEIMSARNRAMLTTNYINKFEVSVSGASAVGKLAIYDDPTVDSVHARTSPYYWLKYVSAENASRLIEVIPLYISKILCNTAYDQVGQGAVSPNITTVRDEIYLSFTNIVYSSVCGGTPPTQYTNEELIKRTSAYFVRGFYRTSVNNGYRNAFNIGSVGNSLFYKLDVGTMTEFASGGSGTGTYSDGSTEDRDALVISWGDGEKPYITYTDVLGPIPVGFTNTVSAKSITNTLNQWDTKVGVDFISSMDDNDLDYLYIFLSLVVNNKKFRPTIRFYRNKIDIYDYDDANPKDTISSNINRYDTFNNRLQHLEVVAFLTSNDTIGITLHYQTTIDNVQSDYLNSLSMSTKTYYGFTGSSITLGEYSLVQVGIDSDNGTSDYPKAGKLFIYDFRIGHEKSRRESDYVDVGKPITSSKERMYQTNNTYINLIGSGGKESDYITPKSYQIRSIDNAFDLQDAYGAELDSSLDRTIDIYLAYNSPSPLYPNNLARNGLIDTLIIKNTNIKEFSIKIWYSFSISPINIGRFSTLRMIHDGNVMYNFTDPDDIEGKNFPSKVSTIYKVNSLSNGYPIKISTGNNILSYNDTESSCGKISSVFTTENTDGIHVGANVEWESTPSSMSGVAVYADELWIDLSKFNIDLASFIRMSITIHKDLTYTTDCINNMLSLPTTVTNPPVPTPPDVWNRTTLHDTIQDPASKWHIGSIDLVRREHMEEYIDSFGTVTTNRSKTSNTNGGLVYNSNKKVLISTHSLEATFRSINIAKIMNLKSSISHGKYIWVLNSKNIYDCDKCLLSSPINVENINGVSQDGARAIKVTMSLVEADNA